MKKSKQELNLLMSYMWYTYIAQCNVSSNLLLLSDVLVTYKSM